MKKISLWLFMTALMPAILSAQDSKERNVWSPFEYFAGSWQGRETGRAGIGKGSRTYEFIMGGQYLYARNQSVFEPQGKKAERETHEDWTFFSYDKYRETFIVRQFNVEGFVNHFVLDSLSHDQKTFVFVTESSENAPPGLRARLRVQIKNENEFAESFELAPPDQDFAPMLQNYWKRKKD